jgi:septum site-determining protein MinC
MGAELIPSEAGRGYQRLVLPDGPATGSSPGSALSLVQAALGQAALSQSPIGALELVAGAWPLTLRELRAITAGAKEHGWELVALSSCNRRTLVAARGLGLEARYQDPPPSQGGETGPSEGSPQPQPGRQLTVHQGTLRSGDHLEAEGSLLVLGDVNPGARISAGAHVLVWGKLRGIAHAGHRGDQTARIVALQLRPLQLRIANAVARGPEGLPPDGFAEEARLVDGVIQIDPAQPSWPRSD